MTRLNVQDTPIPIMERYSIVINILVCVGDVKLRYRLEDMIVYLINSMCLPSSFIKKTISGILK
jgi:hypothetical protein